MDRKSRYRSASCIIMAFNEEATIALAIEEVLAELKKFSFDSIEIIVVDDGSTDNTNKIATEYASRLPQVKIIRHERNKGPGSGIKTGILNSSKELILFHAADRQLDFSEVASYIPMLDDYDLLIGERKDRPGYTVARKIVSWISITLVKILFGLKYKDYNFLYLYRRSVFEGMKIESGGIFLVTEILVKAIDKSCKVREISVGCYPRKFGNATCGRPSIIIKTFLELVRFWVKFRVFGIRK
jgi:glycosyltransferase involved in cell wall biosynthesis